LATLGDWMQGPYIYDLYDTYGLSHAEVDGILVAGFASSGIVGCFIGRLVDRCGRKAACLVYCVLFMVSCLLMHFKDYWAMLTARAVNGLGTSLLFSSFECWMVSEHTQRHEFSPSLLGFMFGMMYTTMYITGIASGFIGELVTGISAFGAWSDDSSFHTGGAVHAFDAGVVVLALAFALIALTFHENYGARGEARAGAPRLAGSRALEVALVGVVVALFESSMFVFVSEWFRCITRFSFQPKIGLLFSMFMMACLCGASTATLLGDAMRPLRRVALAMSVGLVCFGAAATAMTLPPNSLLGAISVFAAFLAYEAGVGLYFPSTGMLKAEVVPEEIRGTVYNLYRLPLNIIVCSMLLSGLASVTKFRILAAFMAVGLACVAGLEAIAARRACGGAAGGQELSEYLGEKP